MSLQWSPLFSRNKGKEKFWVTKRGHSWVLMQGNEGFDSFDTEDEALKEMGIERSVQREQAAQRNAQRAWKTIPQSKEEQLEKIRQMYLAK